MTTRIFRKKINNEVVKPFKVKQKIERPIMGSELFDKLYCNIYLCARRESGKTTVIQNIVQKCCNPETKIICFCSTVNTDPAYLSLKKFCKKHHIPFTGYDDIKEGKINRLTEFVKTFKQKGKEHELDDSSEEEEEKRGPLDFFGGGDDDDPEYDDDEYENENFGGMFDPVDTPKVPFPYKEKSIRPKYKFRTPEYLFIFDDLSDELKSPVVTTFLKSCRHHHIRAIFASQWPNDLQPSGLSNMDYILLFRGCPEDKLHHIYEKTEVDVPYDNFERMYKDAIQSTHDFLYIDVKNSNFRRNFNSQYIIEKKK